jgi:hypothetical protein
MLQYHLNHGQNCKTVNWLAMICLPSWAIQLGQMSAHLKLWQVKAQTIPSAEGLSQAFGRAVRGIILEGADQQATGLGVIL